jgi:hypothetical protein
MDAKQLLGKIKTWLAGLSFRTGVIVLLSCIPFYILSFAQMALPISVEAKVFFGSSFSEWPRLANMED